MFDVDGTLVKSFDFDEQCFITAVSEVLGHNIDSNWSSYKHVTNSGILAEHLERKNILTAHEEIYQEVKVAFIKKVKMHLSVNPAIEVSGASSFIAKLKELDSVSLSIATGGWLETAQLKLESAGIDISSISIASSNEHHSRTEIMKMAKDKANVKRHHRLTYFGDAAWDQRACQDLGYNFVLVGSRIAHSKSIKDFNNINQILTLLGI